jgi:hypothetical protein
MATKPQFTYIPVASQSNSWDAAVDDQFSSLGTILNAPLPVADYTSGTLPNATEFLECIAVIKDGGSGSDKYLLAVSDGASWAPVGQQAADPGDPSGFTLLSELVAWAVDLRDNLRAAGVIA